jgi:ParB-like chromosome segregation protein Spo0J
MIDRGSRLKIELMPLAALKPDARNPRTHSPKQLRQIADSIRKFGFTNPLLLDADSGLLAGHGRLAAAKLLGLKRVPTIRLDHLSEAEKRAYILADNKLAENAGWDRELLALELRYISELDLDLDLTVIGFQPAEIDFALQGIDPAKADAADEVPEVDESGPPVSRIGDLWRLGDHHLLCADAQQADSFGRLLGGTKAQLIFTDPPFNLSVRRIGGRGAIKHREFVMCAGELSATEFTAFLKIVFQHLVAHSAAGSLHFAFMDWRHMFELLSAARETYTELKALCVWNKSNGGQGSLYRSKHELVFLFKNGTRPHINNIELGRFGRCRNNVWDYPGVNTWHAGRLDELQMHPTPKPTALVADALLDCSRRGGSVLDCFGGSGTTLIAAEQTGRRGYLMELDPAYVDVTIKRFEKLTGTRAIHAESGAGFSELQQRRLTMADSSQRTRRPRTAQRRSLAQVPTAASDRDGN